MKRCLDLAFNGSGRTSPNPMVGAVIVHNGKIIGEGYHKQAGGPHAEVNAVNSVKDKSFLKESTLYVNLEPCSHFGKTPPCSQMILDRKIPRVVTGASDTSIKVNGTGIQELKEGNCEVITGILEKECRYLNRRFFTFHEKKRPYIILKWAKTKDGFIDSDRKTGEPPVWITNHLARILVHKWRAEESAIMAGTNTLIMDNPLLTVREWEGRQPVRVVIDKSSRLPSDLNVFDGTVPTLVFTSKIITAGKNLEYIKTENEQDVLNFVLSGLYNRELISLFVEGGNELLTSFITANLWDEARVFTGNRLFHKGVKAPQLPGNPVSTEMIDDSILEQYINNTTVSPGIKL